MTPVDNLIFGYALIAIGVALLLADLVLMSGIVAVLAIAALIVGVTLVFSGSTPSTGIITLIVLFVAIPILVVGASRMLSNTSLGKRMFLSAAEEDETFAKLPSLLELEHLRGRYGRTVSALRPAGVTDFDGRRVDTITEGEMIEPGQWVRCLDVQAGKVIVRQVDKPPDLSEIDTSNLQ
jgi:membrane-bound serine protease (ClpP class)